MPDSRYLAMAVPLMAELLKVPQEDRLDVLAVVTRAWCDAREMGYA